MPENSEDILYQQRPTWTEINLDNLAANFRNSKRFIGEHLKYMAVVKANAYGHGAVNCARRVEKEGIDWFGVALPEEGVELRQAGIRKLILCLGGFWRGQEKLLLNNHLTPAIFDIETARAFNRAAGEQNVVADIHVKIDTGMGRLGVRYDAVNEFADALLPQKNLRVDGIMTHLAAADNLAENNFTGEQTNRFNAAVESFRAKGFRPSFLDIANSPGAVVHPETRGNMVRLGGILYGLGGDVLPEKADKPDLQPVMSLYSRIALIKKVPAGETLGYSRTFQTERDTLVATVPIGYQDGYARGLSNQGRALVNGQFISVVGRVSMDWTLFDVTDVGGVKIGDSVTLIGTEGDKRVLAEDLARLLDTISYEITCGISKRVPRITKG
jgi:alanine racemase